MIQRASLCAILHIDKKFTIYLDFNLISNSL